jgi:hypothetical protein
MLDNCLHILLRDLWSGVLRKASRKRFANLLLNLWNLYVGSTYLIMDLFTKEMA